MTDADFTTIGVRLALTQALSGVVAMLQPELTDLDHAVAANGLMLQQLTLLGQGLNAITAYAAPHAAPSPLAQSSEMQWAPPGFASAHAPVMAGPSMRRAAAGYAVRAMPPRSQRTPSANHSSRSAAHVSRPGADTSAASLAHQPDVTTGTDVARPQEQVAPRALPFDEEQATPSAPAVRESAVPDAGEPHQPPLPSIAPGAASARMPTVTTFDRVPSAGRGEDSLLAPDMLLTLAGDRTLLPSADGYPSPGDRGFWPKHAVEVRPSIAAESISGGVTQAQPPAPTASNTVRRQDFLIGGASSSSATNDDTPPAVGSAPTAAGDQSSETTNGSDQGTILLDGAQITRWMIDQLERHAERPRATVTGIDPRMTATYPGAPTGA